MNHRYHQESQKSEKQRWSEPSRCQLSKSTPPTNYLIEESQFNIWIEELKVYLSQEADFRLFLPGEAYAECESHENNPDRLTAVKGEDEASAGRTVAIYGAKLKVRHRQLRTVLSVVGSVSIGHYDAVKRISTSLRWIYDMLRRDYDIQKKGIHFFNLLDLNYDPAKLTPTAFSTDPMIVLRIIKFIKLSRI